jgi:hypothetical protein
MNSYLRTATEPRVEEQLMVLHKTPRRTRGTMHLLYEALQNGRGDSPTQADAVSAVVEAAQKDMERSTAATEALVELHLRPPPAV